jgi:hypothetical protein
MNRVVTIVALAAAIVGVRPDAAAQARTDRIAVPLTDPSRPATLDVNLTAGIIDVTATDAREIIIEATSPTGTGGRAGRGGRGGRSGRDIILGPGAGPGGDATGLTRLEQPTGLDIEEANNVVWVKGPVGVRVDLTIRVPVRTNFKLTKTAQGSTLGTVTVRGLDGDLEIHTEGGNVTLIDVSGSVVAHSSGGSIVATVKRVTPDRPMAFTSYTGTVDVSLPRSIKADLILRSDLRDVFTDFDVQVKPTAAGGVKSAGGGFRRSGNQPLHATVNGGGPEVELRTYAGNVFLRRGN